MEIFTKNSAKCTIFQRTNCNNFSSLMNTELRVGMLVVGEYKKCPDMEINMKFWRRKFNI
jgi:hypothetical protein